MDALQDLAQTAREVAPLIATLRDLCGDDEQAFLDTLEGEADVYEAARRVVRWMLEQDANATACKGLAETYEARASMFAERHMKARAALLDLMNEIGVKSMPLPEASLSAKATPPRLIGDAEAAYLPDDLVRIKREPNKTAIKAALEAGRVVPGFTLSNGGQSLQVRVR